MIKQNIEDEKYYYDVIDNSNDSFFIEKTIYDYYKIFNNIELLKYSLNNKKFKLNKSKCKNLLLIALNNNNIDLIKYILENKNFQMTINDIRYYNMEEKEILDLLFSYINFKNSKNIRSILEMNIIAYNFNYFDTLLKYSNKYLKKSDIYHLLDILIITINDNDVLDYDKERFINLIKSIVNRTNIEFSELYEKRVICRLLDFNQEKYVKNILKTKLKTDNDVEKYKILKILKNSKLLSDILSNKNNNIEKN